MNYYLHALYKSIVEPSWLARQSREMGKSSVLFVLTVLVLSIGVSVRLAYVDIPRTIPMLQEVIGREIPDFTAQISDGTLSVSQLEQPYVKYFEYEDSDVVIVIDTTTNTTRLDTFFTTSTEVGFLITAKGIVSKTSSTSEIMNEQLTRFPNMTISKQEVVGFLDSFSGRGQVVLAVVTTAFTFLVWGIGLLLFIMIFASIVYGLYRALSSHDQKNRYTWRQIVVLSLFTFVLPKLSVSFAMLLFPGVSLPFIVSGVMGFAVARALGIPPTPREESQSATTLPS